MPSYQNPFRPGAGHMPPYLAGRDAETHQFRDLLKQKTILSNLVLTGLRGVGKTVLLDTFKPIAVQFGWLWVGTDLSESSSVNEETIALRLLTDLSVVTSGIVITESVPSIGFGKTTVQENRLTYTALIEMYRNIPGLVADKLKAILEFVWKCLSPHNVKGIIFAYDEAQTMSNHLVKDQYPLSLLLDVFQSIQKKDIPFMLVLVGLPTLFPKLVEARTFAERMFRIMMLDRLDAAASKEAIVRPIRDGKDKCPISITEESISLIISTSGGYPYFIQFICKEVYDVWVQKLNVGEPPAIVPVNEISRKLDKDFFAGRWARATDRQRELMSVIASLDNCDDEFTVQEIVNKAKTLINPFGSSHVSQMLSSLTASGLIYKNRYGKYAFAVPLIGQFIKRQEGDIQL